MAKCSLLSELSNNFIHRDSELPLTKLKEYTEMGGLISRNLAHPSNGLGGLYISNFLASNVHLEQNAARICDIQPHQHVLEVGYGPGLGLKHAYEKIKDGSGMLHGIDISQRMYNLANQNLSQEIAAGKVHLHLGSVTDIPYENNKFDHIFHCNCYYFWPDIDLAGKELHRVIKPRGIMIATLDYKRLKNLVAKGYMQCGNIDPDRYMKSLEDNGFIDVFMKAHYAEDKPFEAIFATAQK